MPGEEIQAAPGTEKCPGRGSRLLWALRDVRGEGSVLLWALRRRGLARKGMDLLFPSARGASGALSPRAGGRHRRHGPHQVLRAPETVFHRMCPGGRCGAEALGGAGLTVQGLAKPRLAGCPGCPGCPEAQLQRKFMFVFGECFSGISHEASPRGLPREKGLFGPAELGTSQSTSINPACLSA